MAYLTDLLLFCLVEEEDPDGQVPPIEAINREVVLRHSCYFRRISRSSGGRFRPRTSVWMTTINYADVETICDLVDEQSWQFPHCVQLAWRSQNQSELSYHRIKPASERPIGHGASVLLVKPRLLPPALILAAGDIRI